MPDSFYQTDYSGVELPDPAKVVSSVETDEWKQISLFCGKSEERIAEQIDMWEDAEQMYEDCFDPSDNKVELYNPTMLHDIVQRVIDNLRLTDYKIRVPMAQPYETQIIKDALIQIEQDSGLYSEITDDDKGALSWALLGNIVLWWGKAETDFIKRTGCPVIFQTVRLSQAYFDYNFTSIRQSNGRPLQDKGFIIMEYPLQDVQDMFSPEKMRGNKAYTGNEFTWGRLPIASTDSRLQRVDYPDDLEQFTTEIGYWYCLSEGKHEIYVGSNATKLECYDDNDSTYPNYPFKLQGENYLPFSLLNLFRLLGQFYGRGVYHRYAKIARNDARRRILAHRYADKNVNPDKFVKITDDRYATFINDVDLNRQIQNEGDDAYIQLRPGEDIAVGDLRTTPLSQEFERMKQDDQEQVLQGGIALQDVAYQPSQKATNTLAIEQNKTRLTNHVQKINAGESAFIRKVILQFIKDHVSSKNEAPVATNVSVPLQEITPEVSQNADLMVNNGISPSMAMEYKMKNSQKVVGQEKKMDNITMGDVADYLKKHEVFIQTDYSAWNEIEYQMRIIQMAMNLVAGTPAMLDLQKEALSLLGYDVYKEDLMQQPGIGEPNMQNMAANPTPIANLPNSMQNASRNMQNASPSALPPGAASASIS